MTDQTPETETDEHQRSSEQEDIAEVQEQLDAEADGDGLAAEAGRGDETGLTQG